MALIDKLVHLLGETALDSPHRAELLFSRLVRGIFAQIAILLGNLGFAQRLVLLSSGGFKFCTQIPGADRRDDNFLLHFPAIYCFACQPYRGSYPRTFRAFSIESRVSFGPNARLRGTFA